MQLDRIVPLPPLVALAMPVLLGTIQWLLAGLLLGGFIGRFKAPREAP
jgi:hypothetical protein